MKQDVHFAMIGEVGGRYSYNCTDDDIAYFVQKCAESGIQRIVHSFYHSPSPNYPSYLMHKNQLIQVEPFLYGDKSPLAKLVKRAHSVGIEVVPFINVATGGQWIRTDYMASNEVWPYIRLISGGKELEKYWTRTRDGKTWLDIGPRDPLGAYGYLSLSFPEVREKERNTYIEFVNNYDVDGIQLEFMIARSPRYATTGKERRIPCCDDAGYWAFGYDMPAIQDFQREYRTDPRTLSNSDPTWLQFRAKYATQHLRELKEKLAETGKTLDISILCFSGTFSSPEDGIAVGSDWNAWLGEGLIDTIYSRIPGELVPFRERFTDVKIEAMGQEFSNLKQQVNGRADVFPCIELPTYPLSARGQATSQEANAVTKRLGITLKESGAESLCFWWFDTVEALNVWPAINTLRTIFLE